MSQKIPGGDLVENHCFIEVKFSDVCRFSDFLVEIICHHVILSSCHHVIMSSCHHVIMSSCSCHHFMMSWCHLRKSWKINDIVKSQLTFQVHLLGLLGKTGCRFALRFFPQKTTIWVNKVKLCVRVYVWGVSMKQKFPGHGRSGDEWPAGRAGPPEKKPAPIPAPIPDPISALYPVF